jgi:hypothetical protein
VYLAPFGTLSDLRQALEATQAEAQTMLAIAGDFERSYLGGTSPFMHQVHIRALVVDFLSHYAELVLSWTQRSLETVARWRDLSARGKTDEALATIRGCPGAEAPAAPRAGRKARTSY